MSGQALGPDRRRARMALGQPGLSQPQPHRLAGGGGPAHQPGRPAHACGHHRRQTLRQEHDHRDEGRADQQLPEKGQRSRQVRRGHVDADGAEDRPEQRPATAERRPDQQLGAQQEAGQLGRHDVGEGGIAEARHRADRAGRDHHPDLHARHRDAEIGAAFLVLADRHQHAAEVAPDEEPAHGRHDDQIAAGDPEPRFVAPVVGREGGKPARRAGELAAGEDQLNEDDWQREGDDGGIERRRAVIEGEPADQRRRRHGDHDAERQSQDRPARAETVMREHQRAGIGADAEEGRLAEGQDAGVAPEHVDGHRQCGEEEGAHQNAGHVGVDVERRRADHDGCCQRADRRRPVRCVRAAALSQGRAPSAECEGSPQPGRRWSARR